MQIGLLRRWTGASLRALGLTIWVVVAAAAWVDAAHAAVPPAGPGQVNWVPVAIDADVDRALADARAQGRPLLLYWGASWCPPCNQLQATLFNRQDFVDRSRRIVMLYADGDGAGAQKLGTRFNVRGYPTMVLFSAAGQELTRLPGEVDAQQALALLNLGLSGGRPVRALLADARAGKRLSTSEWRALAYYDWQPEDALLARAQRPAVLAQLAAACPDADSATRLKLAGWGEAVALKQPVTDAAPTLKRVLANATTTRAQMDMLVYESADLLQAAAPSPGAARDELVTLYDRALQGLQADASLSRADRLGALIGRIELARAGEPPTVLHPSIAPTLVAQMRSEAARADAEIVNAYERQAVVTTAAYGLTRAGLWNESDALLKANLGRSAAPYYLMSQLAGNARKQGRSAEALDWYAQAYAKSIGPATRLQWGANYLDAVVELAPQDAVRVETVARSVYAEAAAQPQAFYERSLRSLSKMSAKLLSWNAKGDHGAVMQRLGQQVDAICSTLPAADSQRAACMGLLRAPAATQG